MAKNKNIDNKDSFKVPGNYFENFSEEIQARISEEFLKETCGNENPFIVPDNYFKNFKPGIITKTGIQKTIQILKPYMAIAAGIIMVFFIWQIVLSTMDNSQPMAERIDTSENSFNISLADMFDFSDFNDEQIESEIDIYINEYNDESIFSLTNSIDENVSHDIDNESVYEYILDSSDDISEYTEVIAQL